MSGQVKSKDKIPPLPKRVLDVSFIGSDTIKLVETDPNYPSHFICLSHRWGNAKPLTTTSTTLQSRLEGIKVKDLSQTFQDAVILTRALRKPYLWIDSLCILQDSASEWEEESAKMGTYYSSSWLTIGAGMHEDGLFLPRVAPSRPYVKLKTIPGETLYFAPITNNMPVRGTGMNFVNPIQSRLKYNF